MLALQPAGSDTAVSAPAEDPLSADAADDLITSPTKSATAPRHRSRTVRLGSNERIFDGVDFGFEPVEVLHSPLSTHIRYRRTS